jgi:hypothetical protein
MNIVYISIVSLSLDINTQQMSFKSVYVVVVVSASYVSFCLSYHEVLIVLYQSEKKIAAQWTEPVSLIPWSLNRIIPIWKKNLEAQWAEPVSLTFNFAVLIVLYQSERRRNHYLLYWSIQVDIVFRFCRIFKKIYICLHRMVFKTYLATI